MKNYPLYERPQISSVAEMIEQKAKNMPDQVVFRFRKGRDGVEEKTFKQVRHEIQRAASWIDQHYGRDNHIAIIGENSYEWVLAFLAVLTSGNVAVPIDKELPAEEIAWMIQKARVTKALISPTYMDLVEGMEALSLRKLLELEGEDVENYALYQPRPDQMACIFFTSGTSGRSKGVMLSHGNLAAEINGPPRMFDPEGDSNLAVLPFHHTFGLNVAVLTAYNYGVTTFLNRSLKRVKEDMLLAKPVVMMMVPMFVEVFHRQIIDGIKKSGRERKMKLAIALSNFLLKLGMDVRRRLFKEIIDQFGGSLRYIICGGAHLDSFYVREFRNIGIEILNGYGTTECSPCVALNRNRCKRDGSVGLLIPGMEARISPEGEVQFKGPVVMMGYYDEPEETAAVLKDGWYSTGDLGYLDQDGFLFLTGRTKNLIILSNGENISPEELENNFQIDPGVREVLVYDQDSKIIAEIYPEEGYDADYFEALKNRINQGRPAYKQIAVVKLRDQEFIKNTTKKIVRYKNIPQ